MDSEVPPPVTTAEPSSMDPERATIEKTISLAAQTQHPFRSLFNPEPAQPWETSATFASPFNSTEFKTPNLSKRPSEVPQKPEIPCSKTNKHVWPEDHHDKFHSPLGRARIKVWPGAVCIHCGGTHPSMLHNNFDEFIEVFCEVITYRELSEDERCKTCPEGRALTHTTETCGLHCYYDHPENPWTFRRELKPFLRPWPIFFNNCDPFPRWYYFPEKFDYPGHEWPLLSEVKRLTAGLINWRGGADSPKIALPRAIWETKMWDRRHARGIRKQKPPTAIPATSSINAKASAGSNSDTLQQSSTPDITESSRPSKKPRLVDRSADGDDEDKNLST